MNPSIIEDVLSHEPIITTMDNMTIVEADIPYISPSNTDTALKKIE
jgi:hypothetical protein